MNTHALPEAKPEDADDVRWALETAHAVWTQGDKRAALSWVRRAAEAAAEASADLRAVELAKAAAELRGVLEIPRTLPPPAPPSNEPAGAEPQARVRHHAVRVAVMLSPDHDGAFLAWPLKTGEAAPSNAHEALFVALDPEADLFVFKL
ncbi:MAG: hypothetical protein IT377_24475 [Polyangiaceae bacterium]|nr:hypothetical protein [Myxococcales bacterium]MCC6902149.1 hypothetical protein [Polyangiaceae bacterium]